MSISGLCQCGCGQPTNVARWNNRNSPTKAGEHYRFLPGHNGLIASPRQLNEIRDGDNHAVIIVRSKGERLSVLVDYDDLPALRKLTWGVKNGYAHNKHKEHGRFVSLYMHHLLLQRVGASDGMVIDHINRNQLDNRRSNLRVVEYGMNCRNAVLKSQSGLRGAYYSKQKNAYVAKVNHHDKDVYLGTYQSAEDAHAASIAYLRKYALIPKCWSPD